MTIGVTSAEFIRKMESKAVKHFGDEDVMGISADELKEVACSTQTVSGVIRKLKEKGMTEFGLGDAAKTLLIANKEAHEAVGRMEEMADLLGKLKMCKGIEGKTERELKEKDKRKLEYIG